MKNQWGKNLTGEMMKNDNVFEFLRKLKCLETSTDRGKTLIRPNERTDKGQKEQIQHKQSKSKTNMKKYEK